MLNTTNGTTTLQLLPSNFMLALHRFPIRVEAKVDAFVISEVSVRLLFVECYSHDLILTLPSLLLCQTVQSSAEEIEKIAMFYDLFIY